MSMKGVADVYPLSPVQEGMLYHSIRGPRSGAFIEQYCMTLVGRLDAPAFRSAWDDAVATHPVLRTAFLWDGLDEPLQVVKTEGSPAWTVEDWSSLPADTREVRWSEFLRADRTRGLDPAQAPVMRMALVRVAADRWRFVWTFHHLLTDGWSTPRIIRDVLAAYSARVSGEEPALSPPAPYRDYIAWLQNRDPAPGKAFWTGLLDDFDEPTPLGVDRGGMPRGQGHDRLVHVLSEEATVALLETARRLRVTLNTLIQGAWALLLHRYGGSKDIVYGATHAGRPTDLPGVEDMVGLFINTVPVRVRIDADATLSSWLRDLQARLTAVRDHTDTPLVDIQRASGVPQGDPLFESIVVFENYPDAGSAGPDLPDLELVDERYIEQSNSPLALLVVPEDELRLILVYDTQRFDDDVMAGIGEHLETLLAAMSADPEAPVGTLSPVSAAERSRLLDDWSHAADLASVPRSVLDLFDERVHRAPDAVAAIHDGTSISYAELRDRAEHVARALVQAGVEPRDPVGLCTHRSIDMVVGLMGILKAGGAYVPLDPAYPADRLSYIATDAGVSVVVTTRAAEAHVPPSATGMLVLDELPVDEPVADPLPEPDPEALAYVIHTSGSTGTPKGVGVTHANLAASNQARFAAYREPVGRFLVMSSFAFDSSVAGIFWTLTSGGALVLPPNRQEQDLEGLADLIRTTGATHTLLLPSLYGLLLEHAPAEALGSLEVVIVAGEACPRDVVGRHHRVLPAAALYNEYGPTEATVWSTVHRVGPEDTGRAVPIGRPIPGARVYVLDLEGRLVPAGVPGELIVGGPGVVAGYLNRPDDTKERFVPPFAPEVEGPRLYRTGDQVRFRADGVLEFLGRVDQQLKIRGYRLEPGEVEAWLTRYPGVGEAAVLPRPTEGGGGLRLFAYLAHDAETDVADVRAWLRERLPEYMVPAVFISVEALPRLPNGKLDARALPVDGPRAVGTPTDYEPRSDVEQTLTRIWCDVLGLDSVGLHEHFLEVGGDSILSIQMISKARQAGLGIGAEALFNHPTIAELARVVETETTEDVDQGPVTGPLPLSPIQEWFFDVHRAAPDHWNRSHRLEAPPDVDVAALRSAVAALLEHHDALRTRFRSTADGWLADVMAPGIEVPLRELDVSGLSPDQQERALESAVERAQASFALSEPPLFRGVLVHFGGGRASQLVLVAHHLIVDAVSWPILIEDLATAYRSLREGDAVVLPPRTGAFGTWTRHLLELGERGPVRAEAPYWKAQLPVGPRFPVDQEPSSPSTEEWATTITRSLDSVTTRALLVGAHAAYNTRINDLLLTALAQSMAPWTGSPTLELEVEGHGRGPLDGGGPDVTRTVGWFTAAYALRLSLPEGPDPGSHVKAIKEQLRGVPNGGVGYGILRRYTDALGTAPRDADLLFNYLGSTDHGRVDAAPFRMTADANAGARSPASERPHRIEINAVVVDGCLRVSWTYDRRAYAPETMESRADAYSEALEALVEHCASPDAGGFTPSDFPDAGLDQDELDRFVEGLG